MNGGLSQMDGLRLEMPAASPRMSRTLNDLPCKDWAGRYI